MCTGEGLGQGLCAVLCAIKLGGAKGQKSSLKINVARHPQQGQRSLQQRPPLLYPHSFPPQDHCSVPNVRCTEDVLGRKTPFLCHIPYQVMELAGDLVD